MHEILKKIFVRYANLAPVRELQTLNRCPFQVPNHFKVLLPLVLMTYLHEDFYGDRCRMKIVSNCLFLFPRGAARCGGVLSCNEVSFTCSATILCQLPAIKVCYSAPGELKGRLSGLLCEVPSYPKL